eukprot:g2997.t1
MKTRRQRRLSITEGKDENDSGEKVVEVDGPESTPRTRGRTRSISSTSKRRSRRNSDPSLNTKKSSQVLKSSSSKKKNGVGGEAADIREAAKQFAGAFLSLAAERTKNRMRTAKTKKPMPAILNSGLNLDPYIDCGESLLNPTLLLEKADTITGQNSDALPEKAVALKSSVAPSGSAAGLKSFQNGIAARNSAPKRNWWKIEEQEMTDSLKRDVEVLKMRQYLHTKRFYKVETKDRDKTFRRKKFHVGTIIAGAFEPKSARMKKHQKARSFVGEMLADRTFKSTMKRRFAAVQTKAEAAGRGDKRKRRGTK